MSEGIAVSVAYAQLTPQALTGLGRLLLPEAAVLLSQGNAATVYALGAATASRTVGLIALEWTPGSNTARLLSVYVDPAYRNRGIGRGLVEQAGKNLCEKGCNRFTVEFLSDDAAAEGRSSMQFLETCGFHPFEPSIHIRSGPFTALLEQDWLRLTLPSAFTVDPWSSLTNLERSFLEQVEDVEYAAVFSPFVDEDCVDRERSVLLRYKGTPIGWNLLEAIDERTMLGKTMCVFNKHQRMARGVALFAESIRRLMAEGAYPNGMFFVSHENEPMRAFMGKYFDSPQLRKQALWRSSKRIGLDRDSR